MYKTQIVEFVMQRIKLYLSQVARKPAFGVSDQVLHKSGCTTTEDSYMLETTDLGSRGMVKSM